MHAAVVLSADTDILEIMLYYKRKLGKKGLNELWFHAIGRYILIHKRIYGLKLGADFCKVIPVVHAMTGCEFASTDGTKAASLKANPDDVYLKGFGSLIPMFDLKPQTKNAESYLSFKKTYSYN